MREGPDTAILEREWWDGVFFSSVVSNVREARARSGRMMDVRTLWVDRCVKDQTAHETRRWETEITGSSFGD